MEHHEGTGADEDRRLAILSATGRKNKILGCNAGSPLYYWV